MTEGAPPNIADNGNELPAWPFQHFVDPRQPIGGSGLALDVSHGGMPVGFSSHVVGDTDV